MLVSTVLIILNNDKLLHNFVNIDNRETTIKNNVFLLMYISLLLLFTAIPAVLVATNCNPNNKILYGIVALFFGDIYLLQWSLRKFVFKSNNYCRI